MNPATCHAQSFWSWSYSNTCLTEMREHPKEAFFTRPVPYPQKCLQHTPNLIGALSTPKVVLTPTSTQGFPGPPLRFRKGGCSYTVSLSYPDKGTSPAQNRRAATLSLTESHLFSFQAASSLALSHESTSKILALGPSRPGALRLRSTEVDAPFHNFSKSQGSQQRLSHLSCASCRLGSSPATPLKQIMPSFLFKTHVITGS